MNEFDDYKSYILHIIEECLKRIKTLYQSTVNSKSDVSSLNKYYIILRVRLKAPKQILEFLSHSNQSCINIHHINR